MNSNPTPAAPTPSTPKGFKTVSFTARVGGKKASIKSPARPIGGGR